MCVYLYIHNKYTQYTHILYKQKLILDAINRLKALIITHYICGYNDFLLTNYFPVDTVKLLWHNQYCIKRYINKGDLTYKKHSTLYLRHSIMREAMLLRLIMLNTQMRLMPQSAGSGTVEQHQALWRSYMTFSPSEPSGTDSSITLYPCIQQPNKTIRCRTD